MVAELTGTGGFSLADLVRWYRLPLPRPARLTELYETPIELSTVAGAQGREIRLGSLTTAVGRLGTAAAILEGRLSGSLLRAAAVLSRTAGRIELLVVVGGFPQPGTDLLKQVCFPSYDDEVDRLQLVEPQVVFSTRRVSLSWGDTRLLFPAGGTFLAAVRCPPALERLLQGGPGERRTVLQGPLPEEEGAPLRFRTRPPATLVAGRLELEGVCVEVVTRTSPPAEDGVRETRVRLRGRTRGPELVLSLTAAVPRDHELLQLRRGDRGRPRVVDRLEDLSPLLGGMGAATEAAARVHGSGGWQLHAYERDVSLVMGKATSAGATLGRGPCTVDLDAGWAFEVSALRVRWQTGFPDDEAHASTFLEAEGQGYLRVRGQGVVDRPFDVAVALAPRFAVTAVAEGLGEGPLRRLVRVLGLRPAGSGADARAPSPQTVILVFETGAWRLTALDREETSRQWVG